MSGDANTERFEAWVAEYGGAIWKIARAYTLTPDEGHDLTQEIFLQLWRSLPQFEGRSAPATWVYRVALNTALGWQRQESRRRVRSQPLVDLAELPAAAADASAAADGREMVERLYEAIRRLNKPDAALVLLYLDGLSYRQMAEILGISETNVGVKLNRAKKTLGQWLNRDQRCPVVRREFPGSGGRASPDPAAASPISRFPTP